MLEELGDPRLGLGREMVEYRRGDEAGAAAVHLVDGLQ